MPDNNIVVNADYEPHNRLFFKVQSLRTKRAEEFTTIQLSGNPRCHIHFCIYLQSDELLKVHCFQDIGTHAPCAMSQAYQKNLSAGLFEAL